MAQRRPAPAQTDKPQSNLPMKLPQAAGREPPPQKTPATRQKISQKSSVTNARPSDKPTQHNARQGARCSARTAGRTDHQPTTPPPSPTFHTTPPTQRAKASPPQQKPVSTPHTPQTTKPGEAKPASPKPTPRYQRQQSRSQSNRVLRAPSTQCPHAQSPPRCRHPGPPTPTPRISYNKAAPAGLLFFGFWFLRFVFCAESGSPAKLLALFPSLRSVCVPSLFARTQAAAF
ncbi:uncharacterized protein K452DRAFT_111810 [Aplosporella prunicola CBS 121167]|uniref:Uncharacterized protein n=1 Tax=Aplosporella prunicola CBS 121167 TaxID=1176127 RepID=A0A6A6B2U6_9PEZI|nr:uncharacterized protein K452DRAFT_111810 [Aplosporella prunicola CBS 121167]KAF2137337.1 hypothetical protein K452DRAFT_111810 [Aplosporella prunicola CBS 121167]